MIGNTIRFKIGFLYTAILGVIILVYSFVLYASLAYILYSRIDEKLLEKVKHFEAIVAEYATIIEPNYETIPESVERAVQFVHEADSAMFKPGALREIDEKWRGHVQELALKDDSIIVYYPTEEVMTRTVNLVADDVTALARHVRQPEKQYGKVRMLLSDRLKVRSVLWPIYREDKLKYIVQVCTSVEETMLLLRLCLTYIVMSIPFVLLLVSILGALLVKRILKPVGEVTKTVDEINHRDMDKRLTSALDDPELVSLVRAVNDMISRLKKSFSYIEEFSLEVAHELKTPLAVIQGEVEVALRKERSANEYEETLRVVLDECGRMLKVMEDLLLLTKIDYHADIFSFEKVRVDEFFRDVYDQMRFLAKKKGVVLTADIPKELLWMNADKTHVRRLFFNVINNAIKFTPSAGTVKIAVVKKLKEIVVSVVDSGCGIHDDDLPRIFERFYHVDGDVSMERGTGLGLTIARSIAWAHHGTIAIDSTVDVGTTVVVTLPLV